MGQDLHKVRAEKHHNTDGGIFWWIISSFHVHVGMGREKPQQGLNAEGGNRLANLRRLG